MTPPLPAAYALEEKVRPEPSTIERAVVGTSLIGGRVSAIFKLHYTPVRVHRLHRFPPAILGHGAWNYI